MIGVGADLSEDVMAAFHRAVASVDAIAPAISAAARQTAERFEAGGRIVYVGAGASGLLAAQDASELPGTFGLDPRRVIVRIAGGTERPFAIDAAAEDDEAGGRAEMLALGDLERDVVLAVSASGSTPYTLGAARAAREAGALLIAFACRPRSPLL